MANHLFRIPCPCCNKMLEIDTRSGKARAMRAAEGKKGKDLDDLLSAQQQDKQRLEDMFSAAKNTESKLDDVLEQQLKRAKEEAKKDKDERPRNIFDLD